MLTSRSLACGFRLKRCFLIYKFQLIRPLSITPTSILHLKCHSLYFQNSSFSSLISDAIDQKERLEQLQAEAEKDKEKRRERTRKYAKYALQYSIPVLGIIFCVFIIIYGAPQNDENGHPIVDELSNSFFLKARFLRTKSFFHTTKKNIEEPIRETLLPDPLREPYIQPRYTLCIELRDVLVHPEWTFAHGWRFKKRPGIDFLLNHCGPPIFEIVVFTSEQPLTAFPVIDGLDPNGYIFYRLFRESTRFIGNVHVKDLSGLNRDLSKVIMVDTKKEAVQCQPENGLVIKPWKGGLDDTDLFDLAVLLRAIANSRIDDVREILSNYRNEDDPIESFRQRKMHLQEEQEKRQGEEVIKSTLSSSSLVGSMKRSLRS